MYNWNTAENEDLLKEAAANSNSIAAMCRLLGLLPRGSNYETLKRHISRLDIDVSHHAGRGWNKGNFISRGGNPPTIKARLIREHGHKCWHCNLEEWMGQPIPLEMDHIDGNHSNNKEDNLRILCNNCHALTLTWRRRKSSFTNVEEIIKMSPKLIKSKEKKLETRPYCLECRKPITLNATNGHAQCRKCIDCRAPAQGRRCTPCYNKKRLVIDWPDYDILINMLEKSNYTQVGKQLGVSDNAVRKAVKRMSRSLDTQPCE